MSAQDSANIGMDCNSLLSVRGADETQSEFTDISVRKGESTVDYAHDSFDMKTMEDSLLSVRLADETSSKGTYHLSVREGEQSSEVGGNKNRKTLERTNIYRGNSEPATHHYCTFCLDDELQTTATHFCRSCDSGGKYICFKCLRNHYKFTKHEDVISLLTFIESSHPTSQKADLPTEETDTSSLHANNGSFCADGSRAKTHRVHSQCELVRSKRKKAQDRNVQNYRDDVKPPLHRVKKTPRKDEDENSQFQVITKPQPIPVVPKQRSRGITGSKFSYINIRAINDKYQIIAIDFAQMSNGDIIMADFRNKSLKILNTDSLQLVDEYMLKSRPLCITCLENDNVAIAFENKLCIERVRRKRKRISTRGDLSKCCGLKNCWGKLYFLSGKNSAVSIFYIQDDHSLRLLRTINIPIDIFQSPDQLETDEYGDTIYVTDADCGVYALDTNGRVLWSVDAKNCRGISFDGSKTLYVCGLKSNKIAKIDTENRSIHGFLSEEHGICSPCSVFYDQLKMRILVGMHNCNYVFCVDMKDTV